MANGLKAHMTSAQRITAVEREAKVLELAKAGYTFRQIADELGYAGHSSAYKAFQRALAKTVQVPADEYRTLHLARLEEIVRTFYPMTIRGDMAAANRILRALTQIADVSGLNAAREVSIKHELTILAERVAGDLGLNTADIIAEAERIVAAAGGS